MAMRPPHTAITELKLDDAELDALLARLQEEAPPPPAPTRDRRDLSAKRHACEMRGILRFDHPDGQRTTHLVVIRNVSAGGLGVLHGRFCHPQTLAVLATHDREGKVRAMPAQVRWCRYIEGSTHELGLQLHEKIAVTDFIDLPDSQPAPAAEAA